jgi:hypothetical protein
LRYRIDQLEPGDITPGRRVFVELILWIFAAFGVRRRGLQDLIGAHFHLERRFAAGEGAGLLREPRERVEYLAAAAAAYLPAGGAQSLGRQPKDRIAV